MNKYVVTIGLSPNEGMTANGRNSMIAAADRWGADFIEIKSPPASTPYRSKINYDKRLPNGRFCYLDGDVVIRSDCPSPFDVVPEGEFGLVRGHHPSHAGATPQVESNLPRWLKKVGVNNYDIKKEYPNTGLVVFDLPTHRYIFEEARRISSKHWDENWWIADQGHVFAAYKRLEVTPCWIPVMMQHHGVDLWCGWSPCMNKLGYHFCGPVNKQIAGSKTVWDELGPERLSPSGTRRWEASKPVAFIGGPELPFYLREICNGLWNGRAVEVGVCWGGLTWYGAQIARDNFSSWVSVDPWNIGSSDLPDGWDWEDIYQGYLMNLRDSGIDDFVETKRMKSVEAAEQEEDESIDLVFIDGDHAYESCKQDIDSWFPKLKKGGVLLGHDYSEKFEGVKRAVNERFGKPDEISDGTYGIWKVTK